MADPSQPITPKQLRIAQRLLKRRFPPTHKRRRGPDPKQKRLGHAIRKARQAANLTQAQLGQKLGIRGNTVHRWETNQSTPTPRHEREMVKIIKVQSVDAAAALELVLGAARGKKSPALSGPAKPMPALAQAQSKPSDAFALALFGLADDLDLPPRRVRRPLLRLIERLRAAGLTLDAAQRQLESWLAEQTY